MPSFSEVKKALETASGIAFDGCHKIYVLADPNQVEVMRKYAYRFVITSGEMSAADLFETIKVWYEKSCPLKFVQSVRTNTELTGDDIFSALVPQR